jgi:hypothetical protein
MMIDVAYDVVDDDEDDDASSLASKLAVKQARSLSFVAADRQSDSPIGPNRQTASVVSKKLSDTIITPPSARLSTVPIDPNYFKPDLAERMILCTTYTNILISKLEKFFM